MSNLVATILGYIIGVAATAYAIGSNEWPTFMLGGLAMLCSLAVNRCVK